MKLQAKIIAGSVLLLVLTMAIAVPASAQLATSGQNVKPVRTGVNTIVRGEGAITDSSGNLFQGHYQLGFAKTSVANSPDQYILKRGQFIISDKETRNQFKVIANTWTFTETQTGYTASGSVTDQNGKTYQVKLDAQMISKFNKGCIYVAGGSFSDNGNTVYNLHYISVMIEKMPDVASTSSTAS